MGYLYWLIALVSFSSLEAVSKTIIGKVDPFNMTFMRFFIGGLFLFFVSSFLKRFGNRKKMAREDFFKILFIGSLNCIFSMTMLQLSVKYGNASSAATLISTSPLFTALFAYLILGEKVSKRKKTGIVLGLIGIIVFGFGMLEGDSVSGIVFGVFAAITFGTYSVLLRKHIAAYGAIRCTAYSILFPSLIYGLLLLSTGSLNIPVLDVRGTLAIFYLGIVVTGTAYWALLEAVDRMGATSAMLIFYVKPVVATVFAILFLGESVGIIKIVGMSIIIVSLFL